jgi:hypothetical protein
MEHQAQPPARRGPLDWSELRYRLDEDLQLSVVPV